MIQQPSDAVSPRARLPQAVRRALEETSGWSDAAPASLPAVLDKLEAQGYSRKAAGDEILRLADAREIALNTHDHALALPEVERGRLVHDPNVKDQRGLPAYYAGAQAREWKNACLLYTSPSPRD